MRVEKQDQGFRPDIEGLRGLAVLLVLLYHAGLGLVAGGFIGVDVFFVISGFLITGLLVRERERAGRISVAAFYARRVRRILPAAAVVLVVTLVAGYALSAPLDRERVAVDAAAAALSIGNVRFALAAGDYFSAVSTPSPFLHYWSLAVEEQFYLIWPALLILAAARRRRPRPAMAVALGLVLAVSLLANLLVTDASPNWAFYSLPTRAWQLALGGLLAVAAPAVRRVPGPLLAAAGWAGLAGVLWAAASLTAAVAYPGAAALVPTLGAAGLVAAGTVRGGPAIVLASAAMRFLGRISYSLYLWHWPILALAPLAVGHELGLPGRLALVGCAIPIAYFSWAFIEEPFRRGLPVMRARPGRTVAAGLTALLVLVTVSGSLAAAAGAAAASGTSAGAEPSLAWIDQSPAPVPTTPSPVATERPSATPTPTARPSATPVPKPTAMPKATVVAPGGAVAAGAGGLPAGIRPSLAQARSDEERLRADGCLAFEQQDTPKSCVYGDPKAAFTVALVGDSHAAHWFPAVEAVAEHRDWRVLTFTKVACPFIEMAVTNAVLGRDYRECASFRDATIARLQAVKPDLTIVAMSRWISPLSAADGTVARQGAAIGAALRQLPGRVAIVVDTPYAGQGNDIPACLSAHPGNIGACAITLGWGNGELERAAARASGAAVLDLTSQFCTARGLCPAVERDMIVYRDSHHMTATFSRSLGPVLDQALRVVLGR